MLYADGKFGIKIHQLIMAHKKVFVGILFILSGAFYFLYVTSYSSFVISPYIMLPSPTVNTEIKIEEYVLNTETNTTTASTTQAHDHAKQSFFTERYNQSIPIVWTRGNLKLSKDIYDWWFKLVNSKIEDPYEVLEKLFQAGANDTDPRLHAKEGGKLYKSCAVVGSSDVIAGQHEGKIIDENEAVFRFNTAPTKGFEEDVGGKTTHRIFYPESSTTTIDYSNSTLLLLPMKVGDIKWILSATNNGTFILKTWTQVVNKISATPESVMVIHPAFMRYVQKVWVNDDGEKYPSTGIVGVIFSLHVCANVSVHAFGANKQNKWGHYYEKVNTKAGNNQHDAEKEQLIIRTLHNDKILKYYSHSVTPWW